MSASSSSSSPVSPEAMSSLPVLNSPDGTPLGRDAIASRLRGKSVALYFSAGWCPMCTSFEPPLLEFRDNAARKTGGGIEVIYVPSDRSPADATSRTSSMDMMSVPHGAEADAIKSRYGVWAGAECGTLGTGRRSGVPALVVLDGRSGGERAFLAAEKDGADCLDGWPLDDGDCLW